MPLKIGDLAKRTGLTVRALHHDDSIGLLTPSARSDAGYRLYTQADIARLHKIQALRQFGLSLADIGATLTRDEIPLAAIVSRQIAVLTAQIAGADALRERLQRLAAQLARGQDPDLADWLTTLEHMTMFDKYFTPEELTALPLANPTPAMTEEWQALVTKVQAQMDAGARATHAEPQALARHWFDLFRSYAGDKPETQLKIRKALAEQSELTDDGMVDVPMRDYIRAAMQSLAPRNGAPS